MHPSRASCLAGCRVASPQAATSHLPAPAPLVAPLSIIALPPLVPLMPLVRLVVVSPIFTPPPPIIQRLRLLSRHCCRAPLGHLVRMVVTSPLLVPPPFIAPSPLVAPLSAHRAIASCRAPLGNLVQLVLKTVGKNKIRGRVSC
jgi:hypothetical protein